MGQVANKFSDPLINGYQSLSQIFNVPRSKRKRESENTASTKDAASECSCESPKKKRLLTTTKYIYQALFKEQKNSDIAVMALNRVWHLHKVYLGQSPYFHSMFNGSWCESGQDLIQLKELDENITRDSLNAVFGSLYSDEIEVEPDSVVAILATATLFHLEGIIDKCTEVMNDNVCENNVVQYYEAAERYGCMKVRKTTFKWLEINLSSMHTRNPTLVRSISLDLMTDLMHSPSLYVMQTEFSLYTLLRTWMFLRIYPDFDPVDPRNVVELIINTEKDDAMNLDENKPNPIQSFYRARKNECCFLATPDGQAYLRPFKELRTQFLINHCMDLNFIIRDNIIPREWLNSYITHNWKFLMRVDHMSEEGPTTVDEETFNNSCLRCGRVLLENSYQKWRWTGFNFGLDLIIVYDLRTINVRRHHRHEHERLLSAQPHRSFFIRASATSINAKRQPVVTETSEILQVTLEKNQDRELLRMNSKLKPPLLISVNLLTTPPIDMSVKNVPITTTTSMDYTVPISEITGELDRTDSFSIDKSFTPTTTSLTASSSDT